MPANDIRRRPLRSAPALFAGFAVIVVLSTVTDLALHATRVFPYPLSLVATSLPLAWLGGRLAPRPAGPPRSELAHRHG